MLGFAALASAPLAGAYNNTPTYTLDGVTYAVTVGDVTVAVVAPLAGVTYAVTLGDLLASIVAPLDGLTYAVTIGDIGPAVVSVLEGIQVEVSLGDLDFDIENFTWIPDEPIDNGWTEEGGGDSTWTFETAADTPNVTFDLPLDRTWVEETATDDDWVEEDPST